MQPVVSVLVKSCGMAWFNLLINNSFIFLVINKISKEPFRSRQVQVHKPNNLIELNWC